MVSGAEKAESVPIPEQASRRWQQLWPGLAAELSPSARGHVRLRTLNNLRWMAIAGQSAALFIVHFALNYPLPILPCAVAVGMSVALNVGLALRYPTAHRLTHREATVYLAYDVLQLATLLYFTGGIQNPFALMFLAPVVIGAATLNFGNTVALVFLALASVSAIAVIHLPLPWERHDALSLPALYQVGIWASLVIGLGFTSIYTWRIASEAARMSAGLAATRLALAREHRMASIGALATAAAHELGTPLGTIAVVSRELERALPPGSPEAEDARLLRAEAERCRGILTRLARPEETIIEELERLPLGALLDDLVSEYRGDDVKLTVHVQGATPTLPEPKVWRAPAVLHGLGNVIANAMDFAEGQVRVRAEWTTEELQVLVEDDGPGFAPDILERIGEPYVTSRPGNHAVAETDREPASDSTGQEGMGLGFFIAKTLIEQTQGTLSAANHQGGGARVAACWPRGAIDGEAPPSRTTVL